MGFFSRDTSRDAAIHQELLKLAERRGMEVEGVFPSLTLMGSAPHFKYKWMQYEREYQQEVNGHRETRHSWYSSACVQDAAWFKDLLVTDEHLLNRIAQFFGAQDIKVDNAAFDAAFTIKCSDENHARALLTPAAQTALLDLQKQDPQVRIINGELLNEAGFIDSAEKADQMLSTMLRVATALGR